MSGMNGGSFLEGYGGRVAVDVADLSDIDPTLESCCRREQESIRQARVLREALERHDLVRQKVEERRQFLQFNSVKEGEACRCCFDPQSDGGEYRALTEYKKEEERRRRQTDEGQQQEEEESGDDNDKKDEDDDDDDEYDYLLDDDEELPGGSSLQDARRAELEWQALVMQTAQMHGYGRMVQLHPLRIWRAAERAQAPVVMHLYEADSVLSAQLDVFLERTLAPSCSGTKFMRANGRSTLSMNPQKEKYFSSSTDAMMAQLPVVVAVREGAVVALRPLSVLASHDKVLQEDAVEQFLERAHVLERQPPPLQFEELCRVRPEEYALHRNMMQENVSKQDEEEDEVQYYDCGVPGCRKSFFHEHVGVKRDTENHNDTTLQEEKEETAEG